jgi:hypothetical protein
MTSRRVRIAAPDHAPCAGGDALRAELVVTVPDGWWAGDASGVDAVLVRDEPSPSGFRTNAVLAVTPVAASVGLDAIAAHAVALAERRGGSPEVRGARRLDSAGAPGLVHLVLFDAGPRADRVAQLQAYLDGAPPASCVPAGCVPARCSHAVRPVWTIAVTALADDLPSLGAELAALVAGVRVVSAVAPVEVSPAVE